MCIPHISRRRRLAGFLSKGYASLAVRLRFLALLSVAKGRFAEVAREQEPPNKGLNEAVWQFNLVNFSNITQFGNDTIRREATKDTRIFLQLTRSPSPKNPRQRQMVEDVSAT